MCSHGVEPSRGVALIGALVVLMIALGAAAVLAMRSYTEGNAATRQEHGTRAQYAADSGIAWAEQVIYNGWLRDGPRTLTVDEFRRRLDVGFLMPRQLGGGKLSLPDGRLRPLLRHPYTLPRTSTTVTALTVERVDVDATSSQFRVDATGRDASGYVRYATALFEVGGRRRNYGDFVLLTQNATCILCHARIDNAERFFNITAGHNDANRVRVGVLDSMTVRHLDADTVIAGTLYLQQYVTTRHGELMTPELWREASVRAAAFDPHTNKIVEDGVGGLTVVDLEAASAGDEPGVLVPAANLYSDYPTDRPAQWASDGELPQTILPVFADLNGDRRIDPADVKATAALFTGEWRGGIIHEIPPNVPYEAGTLPVVGNRRQLGKPYRKGGYVHEGNYILVGTADDPIRMDGHVGIQGDVILCGVVEGQGQLYASGNIYVVGDLTYARHENAPWGYYYGPKRDLRRSSLLLGAGQNILIGDYLTPKGGNPANLGQVDTGNHLTTDGFSFVMSEMALFNRSEWERTQKRLPDRDSKPVRNPRYDPTHVPVYFTMSSDSPVYLYNGSATTVSEKVKGTYFDRDTMTWQGREHPSQYFLNEDRNLNGFFDHGEDLDGDDVLDRGYLTMYTRAEMEAAGAELSSLNPTNGWIAPERLKAIWRAQDVDREAGQPLQVDAVLRTGQAIFALSRSYTKYGSKTYGQLAINGALIAPHVGLLAAGDSAAGVPVGLYLNYDATAAAWADSRSTLDPVLTRVARWYGDRSRPHRTAGAPPAPSEVQGEAE